MRSWFSPPNHNSPWRVTHTEPAAWLVRPAASRAVATSSISPACWMEASHNSRPRESLRPVHTVPRVAQLGLVVVGVEATHHAFAAGGGDAGLRLDPPAQRRPGAGRQGLSASAWKRIFWLAETQPSVRSPAMTLAGHSGVTLRKVCTSPPGSA
jgi:hypothetical protein